MSPAELSHGQRRRRRTRPRIRSGWQVLLLLPAPPFLRCYTRVVRPAGVWPWGYFFLWEMPFFLFFLPGCAASAWPSLMSVLALATGGGGLAGVRMASFK